MVIFLFTFHYGYILIVEFDVAITGTPLFTFHYGYILIKSRRVGNAIEYRFTFHYGYILMYSSIYTLFNLKKIYIPLWLYSYVFMSLISLSKESHLHSTMVIFLFTCSIFYRVGGVHLHSTMVIFLSALNQAYN